MNKEQLQSQIGELSMKIWDKQYKYEMDCTHRKIDFNKEIEALQTKLNFLRAEHDGTLRPAVFYSIFTDCGTFKVSECDDRQDDFSKQYIDSGNYFLDREAAENVVAQINAILGK